MTVPRRIGFAYNPTKEEAVELSARATGWCAVRGIETYQDTEGRTRLRVHWFDEHGGALG